MPTTASAASPRKSPDVGKAVEKPLAACYIIAIMEKIFITEFWTDAVIGTLPEERLRPQRLRLDLELRCDASRAAVSDDLRDAVDYSAVERAVADAVEKSSFFLLEALAKAVGDVILSFPGVTECTVRIAKPGASVRAAIAYEAEFSRSGS